MSGLSQPGASDERAGFFFKLDRKLAAWRRVVGQVQSTVTRMLRPQFVIVESDGVWKVRHDGTLYGSYETERAAVHAAIEAAERAPKAGHEPRVVVHSKRTGQLQVEWTFGDPYPPDILHSRMHRIATLTKTDPRTH